MAAKCVYPKCVAHLHDKERLGEVSSFVSRPILRASQEPERKSWPTVLPQKIPARPPPRFQARASRELGPQQAANDNA